MDASAMSFDEPESRQSAAIKMAEINKIMAKTKAPAEPVPVADM
jgi:hypothetical protein